MQEERQTEIMNLGAVCEASSATEESCKLAAVCHCTVCGKWFCAAHLADELAHECAPEPDDEDGEG